MAKFVEMDDKVKFKNQLKKKIVGSVILINKFNVSQGKVEQFLKDRGEDATNFKQQPGIYCLHNYIKGLGKVAYSLTMQCESQ